MELNPLTPDQIEQMDVAAAQIRMGQINNKLQEVMNRAPIVLDTYSKARLAKEMLKWEKEVLTEMARNLKNIIRGG